MADGDTTFIATLAAPPDFLRGLPAHTLIATVIQTDLLRRYPEYRQLAAPDQPAHGLALSLSAPELDRHYALTIDQGQVTITAPVPANEPDKPPEGLHTPFTVQLEREIKRLLARISAAALAQRIRAALADDPAAVSARPVVASRGKFTGDAIELRATLESNQAPITLLVYPAGYLHLLLDAPDLAQASRSCDVLVARLRAHDIPVMLTKAPQPLLAERLVVEPRDEHAPVSGHSLGFPYQDYGLPTPTAVEQDALRQAPNTSQER